MADTERTKQVEALRRAMSVNRMIDYGMTRPLAERAHREVLEGKSWDTCLEALADEEIEHAHAAEINGRSEAAPHWRAATASLIFAQMAFNFDTDRKRNLYARVTSCFAENAARSRLSIAKVQTSFREGLLFGWLCQKPGRAAKPTVIVFGGMSGWATAYLSMAEALCDAGLSCLLVDGPGQGESWLTGGVFLSADVAKGFSRFVDLAAETSEGAPVALWGNSFGGLFAALTAAADPRVAACCINGAPSRCEVPPFRTAAEQMAAMFGAQTLDEVAQVLPELTFDGARTPIAAPMLILEGGADPLVPLGSQVAFRQGNHHPMSQTLTWEDGEHTIYNHYEDRNRRVSRWLFEALVRNRPR